MYNTKIRHASMNKMTNIIFISFIKKLALDLLYKGSVVSENSPAKCNVNVDEEGSYD